MGEHKGYIWAEQQKEKLVNLLGVGAGISSQEEEPKFRMTKQT